MDSPLCLRLLTPADLPFADAMRALAGWNQTLEDWQRFLSLEPDGCFLAEWDGAPAGTAVTTIYQPGLSWIGMVLVHPTYRRRGIGGALVQRCLEYLRGRGVRCIKLDATPQGRTVYHTFGFQDEWTLRRWVRHPASTPTAPHDVLLRPRIPDAVGDTWPLPGSAGVSPASSRPTPSQRDASAPRRVAGSGVVRPWRSADAPLIAPLDAAAFGVSRDSLVQALAQQSRCSWVLESEPGRLAGYGLLRTGSHALYLGPVTAMSADAGLSLIEALLAHREGQGIFWDIPDPNAAAVSWAERHGFTVQRPLTRMFLGENFAPGDPRQQFALAGPETG